jgi:osmotically inducible protein OsmC
MPKELGGDGAGTNPEQLFAVGHAACFEASLALAAQRVGASPAELTGVVVESRVGLVPTAAGDLRLDVALDVTLPAAAGQERAAALVLTAHGICPYSRAIRGNVAMTLTANGVPVSG